MLPILSSVDMQVRQAVSPGQMPPKLPAALTLTLSDARRLLDRDARSIANYTLPNLLVGMDAVSTAVAQRLRLALKDLILDFSVIGRRPPPSEQTVQRYLPHRDWKAAIRNACRTGSCVLVVGTRRTFSASLLGAAFGIFDASSAAMQRF